MNPNLLEVCHRLEIDNTTENNAINIYNNTIIQYPTLRKNIIISTSVYIAAKKICPANYKRNKCSERSQFKKYWRL